MVSLVQAATTLPLFLLALPAGALRISSPATDPAHRTGVVFVTTRCWVLTITGVPPAVDLLVITLAIGAGSAVDLPAWQAIIPETVRAKRIARGRRTGQASRSHRRAIGPAVAGVIIVAADRGRCFSSTPCRCSGVFIVLCAGAGTERAMCRPGLASAMRAGVRYVRHAPGSRQRRGPHPAFWRSRAIVGVLPSSSGGSGRPVSYGALVRVSPGVCSCRLLPTWRSFVDRPDTTGSASSASPRMFRSRMDQHFALSAS